MAWLTFLTAVSIFYVKVILTYVYCGGGKLELETLLVADHKGIAPGVFAEPPQVERLTGYSSSLQSVSNDIGFTMVEMGFGNFEFFTSGYPILNFLWS